MMRAHRSAGEPLFDDRRFEQCADDSRRGRWPNMSLSVQHVITGQCTGKSRLVSDRSLLSMAPMYLRKCGGHENSRSHP